MTDAEKWALLCDAMQARFPVLASVWIQAHERFGDAWLPDCVRHIERLYGPITSPLTPSLAEMLEGYAEFASDAMRNQVYYERAGRYRASSYAEVAANCYHNEEHMTRRYLPGLYVSHYLWPQHYHTLKGFTELLLPRVRRSRLFFEVGVGCGVYSLSTLEALPGIRGVGFDISAHSLAFTERVVAAAGFSSRYQTVNQDIRHGYPEAADFLICQEVLEHLENPAEFCSWLRELIRPGGAAFITAALNAGHSDHIYHFGEPGDVELMLRDAGFQPLQLQEALAPGTKPRRLTPSIAGFFCERRG